MNSSPLFFQWSLCHHPSGSGAHPLHLLKFRDWLQIDLVSTNVHQDRIAGRHAPFDEVFLALVAHLVELAEPSDFTGSNWLLTSHPFRLLIIPSRNAPLEKKRRDAEGGHLPSRSNHRGVKDVLFG